MKLQQLEVQPGEKKSGYLKVEGNAYELPVTVICGEKPGKTVLITAGIHNAEYVGIQAAVELQQELTPEEVAGTVVIVPLVNVSGFAHRTMSLIWEDQKNLNREFPGSVGGTIACQFCYTIERDLFSAADCYIDLHCGDGYEALKNYAYYVGPVDPAVRETAYQMARRVQVDYLVESQGTSGGAYNYASSLGIPSVLLERGCQGKWSRDEVDLDKADVRRMLAYLGALEGDSEPLLSEQRVFTKAVYEDAPLTGFWYPVYQPGEAFEADAVLGEIRDVFGQVLHTCRAKAAGVILYETASLNVLKDGPMVAYGLL